MDFSFIFFFCFLESVHQPAETTAAIPRDTEPTGSMGAGEQQRDSSGELSDATFSSLC